LVTTLAHFLRRKCNRKDSTATKLNEQIKESKTLKKNESLQFTLIKMISIIHLQG